MDKTMIEALNILQKQIDDIKESLKLCNQKNQETFKKRMKSIICKKLQYLAPYMIIALLTATGFKLSGDGWPFIPGDKVDCNHANKYSASEIENRESWQHNIDITAIYLLFTTMLQLGFIYIPENLLGIITEHKEEIEKIKDENPYINNEFLKRELNIKQNNYSLIYNGVYQNTDQEKPRL